MTAWSALYAEQRLEWRSVITFWKGWDMWFRARSVYTTEYSNNPPFLSLIHI